MDIILFIIGYVALGILILRLLKTRLRSKNVHARILIYSVVFSLIFGLGIMGGSDADLARVYELFKIRGITG